MSSFYFSEYCFLLFFLSSFFFYWWFFFKMNFYNVRRKTINVDIVSKVNFLKKINFAFFVKYNAFMILIFIPSLFIFHNNVFIFWWNHLTLSNFSNYLVFFFIFFSIFVAFYIYGLAFGKINYSVDYFFAICNLVLFLPLIFLSNNMFTFFFLLEVNSLLIFYKFVVSKIWYKNSFNLMNVNLMKFNKIVPKAYLNVLFFQFWTSFFSSVLILFFLIVWLHLYTTSEWFLLNLLVAYELDLLYLNNALLLIFLISSFLIGLSLKIGITPFHLFKVEVYKGIPFLSIFFYTTFYFLNYFLFFMLLVCNYLISLSIFYWILFLVILTFGCFYMCSLLFDINYIKAFFAYSTIVNTMGFTCALISNLNFS